MRNVEHSSKALDLKLLIAKKEVIELIMYT